MSILPNFDYTQFSLFPEVAEQVFNRCISTNEEDIGSKEGKNFQVFFNYEFLEDDRDPRPSRLARLLCG